MTAHAAITDQALMDLIAEEALLDRETLRRERSLEDLGVSSLDFMTIIFEVEERYGVALDESAIEGCQTLGDLIDRLKARLREVG